MSFLRPTKSSGFTVSRTCVAVVAAFIMQSAGAMQALDEAELSEVSGQDGITLALAGNQAQLGSLLLQTDAGTALESNLAFEGVTLSGVGATGIPGGGFILTTTVDVGADGAVPAMAVNVTLPDVRLAVDAMKVNSDPADPRSFGALAIDGSAAMNFVNFKGLFDIDGSRATLSGSITDGRIFYRQLWHEHPYLIFNNLQALWNMRDATIGIADLASDPFSMGPGLLQAADRIDLRLEADWQYKFPVGMGEQPFTVTGNELPMLRFGWSGAVRDASLVWRAGGAWTGNNYAAPSEGLAFSSRWNYMTNAQATALGEPESEFRWVFGEAGGGVQFELSDWAPLGNNPYAFNFPLIAIDALNPAQALGGLCFGAPNAGPLSAGVACTGTGRELVNLNAGHVAAFDRQTYGVGGSARTDAHGLGVVVRDGNLLANSNQLKLVEGGIITREFDWGLIYTLANVDANIFVYPGGNPSDDTQFGGGGNSLDSGLIVDLLLMSQSFDGTDNQGVNWNQGSHFMLADTAFEGTGVGIGFLSSSVLLGANDARVWIKPQWNPADFYEGGLDVLAPQARIGFRGIFGGATLPSATEFIEGAFLDMNLEGLLNLRLSPSDPAATIAANGGANFLGFSLAARLGDLSQPAFGMSAGAGTLASGEGSYIAIAEPSRKDVEIRLGDIRGDIALVNGVSDLRGENEEAPGSRPALVISTDILLGETALPRLQDAVIGHTLPGGAAAQPFLVNNVSFSGNTLGRIAVPSGHWGATLTLKPQL